MEFAKGMAAGFVIGVALIGATVVLLYYRDDTAHEREVARIAELETQVQSLEHALARKAVREAPDPSLAAVPTTVTEQP